MQRRAKFWCGVAGLWLIVGTTAGALLFWRFHFLVYFLAPFTLVLLVGAILTCLVLGFSRTLSGRRRLFAFAACAALILGVVFTGPVYRARYEEPSLQGPYLTWSDDPASTMTVSWTTPVAEPSSVKFRPGNDGQFQLIEETAPTQYHSVTIRRLTPDTRYQYQVHDLGDRLFSFQTGPSDMPEFSFVVYGDTRPLSGLSYHAQVVRAILKADEQTPFSFGINTGDIVENPHSGYKWQWQVFLDNIVPFARSRPYLLCPGNHEMRGGSTLYKHYLNNGMAEPWYDLDYAGVHLIFLSTQDELAPDSPQYQWLKGVLEESGTPRATIVFSHQPMLTYGSPKRHYADVKLRKHVLPLLKQHGVQIMFCGHVHSYEHLLVDGVHQVITGGGGVLLWDKPGVGPETVCTETTFHFCTVNVGKDAMCVTAHRIDGSIIDRFDVVVRQQNDKQVQEPSAGEQK